MCTCITRKMDLRRAPLWIKTGWLLLTMATRCLEDHGVSRWKDKQVFTREFCFRTWRVPENGGKRDTTSRLCDQVVPSPFLDRSLCQCGRSTLKLRARGRCLVVLSLQRAAAPSFLHKKCHNQYGHYAGSGYYGSNSNGSLHLT